MNHLTRELHELEDSVDVHLLMNERKAAWLSSKKEAGGSVQTGINAFFTAKGKGAPHNPFRVKDDVEVVEIDDDDGKSNGGGTKRSGCIDVGSAEKKLKTEG